MLEKIKFIGKVILSIWVGIAFIGALASAGFAFFNNEKMALICIVPLLLLVPGVVLVAAYLIIVTILDLW